DRALHRRRDGRLPPRAWAVPLVSARARAQGPAPPCRADHRARLGKGDDRGDGRGGGSRVGGGRSGALRETKESGGLPKGTAAFTARGTPASPAPERTLLSTSH